MRLSSVEGEQLTELDKAARLAIETGQVSLDADYALNPVIYNRYKEKLEGIAARRDSQEFKDGSTRIEKAVKGMMPKNRLGNAMIKKLHVYQGPEHNHHAQKPVVKEI